MEKTPAPRRGVLARLSRRATLSGLLSALAVPLAVSAALAQPAAPEAWAKITAGAAAEKRVVVYSAATPAINQRLKAEFEKAHPGMILEPYRFGSGELMIKLGQERQTGADGADIGISTEMTWFADRAKEGVITAPSGPSMAAWPAKYISNGVVVAALEPLVMVYNTDLKNPPQTARDLLKPEFAGKIGLEDLASTAVIAFYDWLEKNQGPDYLPALANQRPRIYSSTPAGAQSVAAGEFMIGYFVNAGAVTPLVQQGAPIKWVITKPNLGIRYGAAIMGWSKRANAAQVFMNFLTSPAGQKAWTSTGDAASPLAVEGSLPADAVEPYDPSLYSAEFVKAYKEKWYAMFKK